jgi:DNA-binding protein H-NS
VSATRAAPAWGLGSSGPWPPATPHGQAPTPYLYKTPPKNIPDPKNSRVTDPKIPEVSAWRAMAGALRRGRSGPYALIFSGRGVRACPHEGPRDLLLLCSLKLTDYSVLSSEITMARGNLSGMSVEALMDLRKRVDEMLLKRRAEIEKRLERMEAIAVVGGRGQRASALRGRKVPPKYRGPSGETWAGRGVKPKWMVEALKKGKKMEDFLIARKRKARRR